MTDEPQCLRDLRELKAVIDARMRGEQVQTVAHRGRNIGYAQVTLTSQINYYRQLWNACPAAQQALPLLDNPEVANGRRGRPAIYMGRGHV